MKLLQFILIIGLIFILTACPEKDLSSPDSTIVFINNTTDTLQFYDEFRMLSDTALPTYTIRYYEKTKLLPFSETKYPDAFIRTFNDLDNHVLMIFLFKKSELDNYSWEEVQNDYRILKRYDLSLQDLENNNWTIEYP